MPVTWSKVPQSGIEPLGALGSLQLDLGGIQPPGMWGQQMLLRNAGDEEVCKVRGSILAYGREVIQAPRLKEVYRQANADLCSQCKNALCWRRAVSVPCCGSKEGCCQISSNHFVWDRVPESTRLPRQIRQPDCLRQTRPLSIFRRSRLGAAFRRLRRLRRAICSQLLELQTRSRGSGDCRLMGIQGFCWRS